MAQSTNHALGIYLQGRHAYATLKGRNGPAWDEAGLEQNSLSILSASRGSNRERMDCFVSS